LNEKPQPGTAVALDTEFVDLEKAEIDVKADGSQEMIRPSKSGLARVSVLRGSGMNEGAPFIDDYITIKDPIVDYVTQYSGIKPGDLDPRTSQHNLVPLKVAYKKLWLLLNLGCKFVGHGLASDFRKINIQVPKSQTVDTQYLFFHPSKNRRLSLRYLAWAVFKEYIQEETTSTKPAGDSATSSTTTATTTTAAAVSDSTLAEGHDSIEDARMALRLWKKFQEYEDAGIISQILEEIFREGFKHGFRPPPRNGNGVALRGPTAPPPSSGRNTPDLAASGGGGAGLGGSGGSAPSTPRQAFRRSLGLTPSNGSFGTPGKGDFFGGSPLR
jgi:PAB-dependent poly(A)-specific ribonuclease subunit 2